MYFYGFIFPLCTFLFLQDVLGDISNFSILPVSSNSIVSFSGQGPYLDSAFKFHYTAVLQSDLLKKYHDEGSNLTYPRGPDMWEEHVDLPNFQQCCTHRHSYLHVLHSHWKWSVWQKILLRVSITWEDIFVFFISLYHFHICFYFRCEQKSYLYPGRLCRWLLLSWPVIRNHYFGASTWQRASVFL